MREPVPSLRVQQGDKTAAGRLKRRNVVNMTYNFQGKQILVLEDDALLAMDMEDFLTDLGVSVVGPVSHIDAALEKINAADLDGAVIDLNLRGELSFPVIEKLKAESIPFVVCSGYAEIPGVRAQLGELTVVSKPCDFDNLVEVLANEFLSPVQKRDRAQQNL